MKPQFFKKNQLIYNYTKRADFWAGNEFFNFDNKAIRNNNLQIARAVKKEIYHHYLHSKEVRKNKLYTYNPDINGQFKIRTIDGDNAANEADYSIVHFELNAEKIPAKEVYVFGAFNNFTLSSENKMTYDDTSKSYKASLGLKQGFYNYMFVTKNNNQVNLHEISGSFYETENEYTVVIYYKPFGKNYDRVIGVGSAVFNSQQ